MKRVRVTSLTAPHGKEFESLRIEMERRVVGTIQSGPCALGYYAVRFPTVADGRTLDVHVNMIEFVR